MSNMDLRDTPKINYRAKKTRIWKRKKKLKRVSKKGKKNRINYNKDIRTNKIKE